MGSAGSARTGPARAESFAITAADGTPLAGLRWRSTAGPARQAVVLVHGFGEHLGRHSALAERLAGRGRLVLGADLRGHGRSGGRRGHVERFDEYLEDLDRLVGEAGREAGASARVVLVGHSLGALIALRHAETRPAPPRRALEGPGRLESGPPAVAGLVLSGIGLRLAVAVPWWKRLAGRVCDRLLPTLAFETGIDAEALSTDPAVCAAYRDDPLVHRLVTARWYGAFEAARAAARADAGRVRCPVLILHGLDDRIADVDGSRRLARALTGVPVRLRLYPGARHEVFTDPACPEVLGDLEAWLLRLEE